MQVFLAIVSEHPYAKLLPTVDKNNKPIDLFTIDWEAALAIEQGFMPLVAHPALKIPYFIFSCKSTGLTGYIPMGAIYV